MDDFNDLFDLSDSRDIKDTKPNIKHYNHKPAKKEDTFDVNSVEVTDEMKNFLSAIDDNLNIFLTGSAGSGKSTLIKYFMKTTTKKIALLAPTGIAASNIGGQTFHSFFQLGIGIKTNAEMDSKRYEEDRIRMFNSIDAIIIDEVSMLRADLVDIADYVLQKHRKSILPFGGVQMIFVGDLNQLPPVVVNSERDYISHYYKTPYFFSSNVVTSYPFRKIVLNKIYRQTDLEFINILNRMKKKSNTQEDFDFINNKCVGKNVKSIEGLVFVTPKNDRADFINTVKLNQIEGEEFLYKAHYEGYFDPKNCNAYDELKLKKDAQIMMIMNDPQKRWVNGTIGTVENLTQTQIQVRIKDKVYDVEKYTWEVFAYKFDKKTENLTTENKGTMTQFPLRLAWANTVHKSQGMTFDNMHIEMDTGFFAHGMAYVALSRCRSLDGLSLSNKLTQYDIIYDPSVMSYLSDLDY